VKKQIEEQESERKDKKALGDRVKGKVGTVGRAGKAKKSQSFSPIHESFYNVPQYATSCPKIYHP
jgi:hypothetical protein